MMNKKLLILPLLALALMFPLANAGTGNTIMVFNTLMTGGTGSIANTLVLPITGNYIIDWDDGNIITYTSVTTNALHVYGTGGVYTLNIINNGGMTGFRYNNGGDKLKLISIVQWGNVVLGNANGYFYGASNMNSIATDSPSLTGTTNLQSMFQGDTAFNGNIVNWNTNSVTNMGHMFDGATSFNQNIGSWNTNSVTDMDYMFDGATAFNQNIGTWNTNRVIDMYYMFDGATAFNQNIGTWNTMSVTDMSGMFDGASSFNQPIGTWNTNSVTNMFGIFASDAAFNQPIGTWNTNRVTNMGYMFDGATSFNQNIGNWNTVKVTTATSMFLGDTLSIPNYDNLLNGWSSRTENILVPFGGGNSKYSSVGLVGRNILTNTIVNSGYEWTITDGGESSYVYPTFNSLTISNATIVAGQNQVLTAYVYNGVSQYTYNVMVFNSIGLVTNQLVTNALTFNSFTFTQNSAWGLGNFVVNVIVTDSQGAQISNTNYYKYTATTGSSPLTFNSLTISNSTIDTSQTQILTAYIYNGVSTYTYNVMVFNSVGLVTNALYSGVSTTSNSFTYVQNANWGIGKFTVNTIITDSNTMATTVSNTNFYTYTANTALGTPTLTTSPVLSNTMDVGQQITLSSSWSGGTKNYNANYIISNSITGTVLASNLYTGISTTSNSYVWTIPSADLGNTIAFNVVITDSATTPETTNSVYAKTLSLNSALAPTISSVPSLSATLDVGQSIVFTAMAGGGTAAYTYNYILSNSITNTQIGNQLYLNVAGTTNTFTFVVPSADLGNTIEANVFVTDNSAVPATANSAYIKTLTIKPQLLSTSWTASNSVLDYNQYQLLSAAITGGTSTYTYNILVYNAIGSLVANQLETGLSSTSNTFFFQVTPAMQSGTYTANVYITDSATTQVTVSNTLTFTVDTTLVAAPPTPTLAFIDNGQTITLTSQPAGGTTPYTYLWHSGASTSCASDVTPLGTAATQAVSPTSNTYYCYTVTDAATIPVVVISSGPANIIVSNSLAIPTLTSSPVLSNTLDVGQSIVYTATWNNATAVFSANYVLSNSITGAIISSQLYTGITGTTNTFTYTIPASALGNTIAANVFITDNAYSPETTNSVYDKTIDNQPSLGSNYYFSA